MTSRAAVAVLVFTACGPGELESLPATAENEQAIRACDPTSPYDGIIIGNSLSTQDLMFNTLLVRRLENFLVTHRSLSTGSFSTPGDPLNTALLAPQSVRVLEYVVGCALRPEQAPVQITTAAGATYQFRGQAGLCPEWATLSPGGSLGSTCLESVSACLLGRNNARGVHVPLSVRGDDSRGPCNAAGYRLRAWDWQGLDRARVSDVKSLLACAEPRAGASRSCGWRSEGVFRCTPGSTVKFGAGAAPDCGAPLGWASTRPVLRLCDSVSACDHELALAESEGTACSGSVMPSLAATCPSTGYVNVMSAPYDSAAPSTVSVGASAAYLVGEQQYFGIREGAFYGTVFDPAALAYEVSYDPVKGYISTVPALNSNTPVAFRRMYSCGDERWVYDVAYMFGADRAGRTCALPPAEYTGGDIALCTATYVGRCVSAPASCTSDEGYDRELRSCHDSSGTLWQNPMTTVLHGACDLNDPAKPIRCLRQ